MAKTPNKFIKLIRKNILALVLSMLVVCWTFVKDVFKTGADAKLKSTVVNIVVTSHTIEHHFDSIIEDKFDTKLKNPMIWFDVLGSDFIGDFVGKKEIEVHDKIKKDLLKNDSLDQSFVEEMGKAAGIRNEDVAKAFGKMLKAFNEGSISRVRQVDADF